MWTPPVHWRESDRPLTAARTRWNWSRPTWRESASISVESCGLAPPSHVSVPTTDGARSVPRETSVMANVPLTSSVSSAPRIWSVACTRPRSGLAAAALSRSRPRAVTSESKTVRLSVPMTNVIVPVCGRRHPRVPEPVRPPLGKMTFRVSRRTTLSRTATSTDAESRDTSRIRLGPSDRASVPSGHPAESTTPWMVAVPRKAVAGPDPRATARSSDSKVTFSESPPHFGRSIVAGPSTRTWPSSPRTSASTATRARLPSSRTGPRKDPVALSEGNPRRIPSNDSGDKTTSTARPSVSPRESNRTRPSSSLAGRAPSRWRAWPRKVVFRHGPLIWPVASRRPKRLTAGMSSRTVSSATSERWTVKLSNTMPLGPASWTTPSPTISLVGRSGRR